MNEMDFNDDIQNWNVSNVTDMSYMFCNAYAFNQPLDSWNVSNVTNMMRIFNSASALSRRPSWYKLEVCLLYTSPSPRDS